RRLRNRQGSRSSFGNQKGCRSREKESDSRAADRKHFASSIDWPLRIGSGFDEAGIAGHRCYRWWRRARRYASRRRPRRAHESLGFDKSAQRRARNIRWLAEDERSLRSGAPARQAGGRTVSGVSSYGDEEIKKGNSGEDQDSILSQRHCVSLETERDRTQSRSLETESGGRAAG